MPTPLKWLACLGRNGWDHPLAVPDDMGTEAVNVVFLDSGLAQRRPGSADIVVTGAGWNGIAALDKYVPPTGLVNAQLVLVTLDDPPRVLIGTTAFAFTALTLIDAFESRPQDAASCQLNNKQFVAYDSGVNRLHVWDPTNSAASLIRVGLALPAVPTAANTGAGTYAATPRWYAIRTRTKVGSAILRQSERGPTLAFTPSGAGTAARVTHGTFAGETETHWVVYGSADSVNGPFYELSEIVIATATYDDSAAPSSYNSGTLEPTAGMFTPFPSVKYLVSDGNRLLGLGAWESAAGDSVTPVQGRVYYTPVLGSTDRGDDERIESTVLTEGWIDLTPNGAGAEDRGLGGPLNGEIYAFQSQGIYRLVPTGQARAPYTRHQLTPYHGGLNHRSIVTAEDEQGNQCVYFLNPSDGPRRIQLGGGMQWLGRDVFDLWQRVNQDAKTVRSFGLYDYWNKRVLWWVAVDGTDSPALILMYDVTKGRTEGQIVRYGWAQWTGAPSTWLTGVMFPATTTAGLAAGATPGNRETPTGGGGPANTAAPKQLAVPSMNTSVTPAVVVPPIGYDPVAGQGPVPGPDPTGSYLSAVGSFTSTGVAQALSVGFQPTFVLVWPIEPPNIGVVTHIPTTAAAGCMRTADMTGTNCLQLNDFTIITNGIISIDANGFTVGVGPAANFVDPLSAIRYGYLAVRDTSGVYFRYGTYVGDGLDNRNIVCGSGAFQPDLVWIYGNSIGGVVRDKNMVGDYAVAVNGVVNVINYIQAFNATGFQVGSDTRTNENGRTLYWLAWKDDVSGNLAAKGLQMGTYVGSGGALAIVVTGWGFPPPLVDSCAPTTEGAVRCMRRDSAPNSTRMYDGQTRTTDITSLTATGFTVGLGASANLQPYYWHAFRGGSL